VSEAPLKELILDVAACQTRDEFYDLFFRAVGAPDWHGRNFDALRDSIATGQINQIEVPYRLVITNLDMASPALKELADHFIDLLHELHGEGVPVEIRVDTWR
jgi:RNAse (barnase) inhibitor barstar